MQIFVDADACPVVGIIETIAEKYNIPTTLLCDTNHILYSNYSKVIVVGAGADAVDYKLISICHKGDIVVSQDYGVAAMALGKGAYAIHQSGKWYTNNNIDQMLMERHLNKKARRSSHKNHIKGPKKRTEEDDVRFAQSFEKMLMMVQEKFQKNTKTMETGRCSYENIRKYSLVYIWRSIRWTGMDFCGMHMVYYDYWNPSGTAMFQICISSILAFWKRNCI